MPFSFRDIFIKSFMRTSAERSAELRPTVYARTKWCLLLVSALRLPKPSASALCH